MKKYLFIILSLILLLAACGTNSIYDKEDSEPKNDEPETEEVENESVENSALGEVELTEAAKIMFGDFSVEIEEAEIAEKDGTNILRLETLYTNDSFPEEKAFMSATMIYVKQGDEELDEITGVMADPKSNYYYKNDPGIWAPIEFEFELINLDDDITINLSPHNEHEDTQTYTIELN